MSPFLTPFLLLLLLLFSWIKRTARFCFFFVACTLHRCIKCRREYLISIASRIGATTTLQLLFILPWIIRLSSKKKNKTNKGKLGNLLIVVQMIILRHLSWTNVVRILTIFIPIRLLHVYRSIHSKTTRW